MRAPTRRLQAAGLVALAAAAVAAPYVLPSYLVGLLTLIIIAAILATSINLLADAGLISVGHAGISAAAGYGLAYATAHGQAWPRAVLAGLAVTLLVSGVYAVTSMRASAVYFLMVTLALGMVVFGLTYRLTAITGGENGITGVDRPPLAAEYWQYYFVCLAALALTLLAAWVVARSPFGLALRGIRDSDSRMRSLGYNVTAYKFVAFMLSGVLAGVSGILATYHAEYISPASAGFARSALGLVMVILGGVGTLLGPLAGAAIVVLIENEVGSYVERWPTVLGLVFIAVVLFVPQGLAGVVAQASAALRGHRPPAARPLTEPHEPAGEPRPSPVPTKPPDPR